VVEMTASAPEMDQVSKPPERQCCLFLSDEIYAAGRPPLMPR